MADTWLGGTDKCPGALLHLKLSKKPHILQQLKGKRWREVTCQQSSYKRMLLSSAMTGTNSLLLLHAHHPGASSPASHSTQEIPKKGLPLIRPRRKSLLIYLYSECCQDGWQALVLAWFKGAMAIERLELKGGNGGVSSSKTGG